jgi:tetratricopeptide (TPR) repeat protein
MRKTIFLQLFLMSFAAQCIGQTLSSADWFKLIDAHQCDAARELCTRFVSSADVKQKTESQKCLANVALCGNSMVLLQGDDVGGGTLSGGYKPEAVDEALAHLNAGIKFSPQDLSIHQGRLHVLEASGRYADMVTALDESCTIYQGRDALQAWLAYSAELADLRQYQYGLAIMRVLEKHYPGSPDVLANVGAFLSIEGKPAEAIPYLQKATDLAPADPINAWDLGRAYDRTDRIELADKWYRKGLSLQHDPKQRSESSCLYAHFVEQKLHDRERACSLEKKDCDIGDRAACGSSPVPGRNK